MKRKPKNNNTSNKLAISQASVLAFSEKDFETDPQGSYTGVPADPDDMPVQDVDDL